MAEFVVISPDPRGFWHADYWHGDEETTLEEINLSGRSPDSFFTQRGHRAVIESKARKLWPNAIVVFAEEGWRNEHGWTD